MATTADKHEIQPARRVVLVEDDELMAMVLRYNLEACGHHVAWVDDGAEVMRTLLSERPDAVVLDWALPNLAGIEILRQLRADPILCTTPVIMVTGQCEPSARARAMATGADRYLTKPISVADFMCEFGNLFAGARRREIGSAGG